MLFEAVSDPEALALDDLTRTRSWRELAVRATRVARLLREGLGLRADDHAAYLMHNRVEAVELVLGAVLAGVWLTPINRHLTAPEIRYVLRDSGARALFVDDAHAELVSESRPDHTLRVGDELDAALGLVSDEPLPDEGPAGGTMIYTSGTTGEPKGVKRQRAASVGEALVAQGRAGASIGLDGAGPHLITGPVYHAAPLLFAVYDQANGAPITIMPRWDERHFLALVGERGVRHTHLVPTMFVRLLALPEEERSGFDPASLRVVLHGAAPVSVPVKQRMIDWWGEILVEYWGGTEGGVTTLVDSPAWRARPGTVGRALPQYEVFAVDETGGRLGPGEVGALYSRHKSVSGLFEYHGAPEKTADAYLAPDTFTLGDVGWVDEEGWVFLADRKTNMIISGGVNIYPAEIEQVLQEHPAVADIGVFGVPDDEWGESVKAAVELAPGFEPSPALEARLSGFAREHLAGYKVPRSFDFHPALPRTPAGKLMLRRLRDPYWTHHPRRI